MEKGTVAKKQAAALCWNERDALSMSHSPFVIGLKYAYQTPTDLVLVLDLLTGGDLDYHLREKGRFSLKVARFVAAETVLGIDHLHSLGFIYRDLKPENILLSSDGHCKISDLGLAVEYTPTLTGYAGTEGYMVSERMSPPAHS